MGLIFQPCPARRACRGGRWAAGGEFAHGLQFLRCGGQGGLDRGGLAEPPLVLGFVEPVDEVGVDFFQAWHLYRVDPEERASDTGTCS